ncbi:DNA helicase-2/ATP-dependent DNA helicase PcrA [Keratinibaculum paraultunense]|uniref:DNA 3'-5' helicase n=1 Tax=Keratinibaculum paraultunense TaxID=1278232 RepID=A0A4R3KZ06_9FIRM|nr:ATP-dependent helicase [Keratinibaculum paraultunense]QQY80222.1 ATP-dependent helicase [Keratinibaculum paraultunense]TCS90734.1 DNA helicase-2/ATP-dependent DNA helicase PcrA [Keratinibaculum paraultunense]
MNLSKEQMKAMQHIKGPALVLAVPGSGKTTVLIHRTANLILNHKVHPDRILSITFSRASARDMKNRFNSLYGDISHIPVYFSTIHSFSYSVIREYAYKNRIKYTLIEDNKKNLNKYNILKNIYFSINNEYVADEKLETIINSIGYIKNMLITPEKFLSQYKINISNFKQIYRSYESYKRNNNLLDFDDMLTLAIEILNKDNHLLNKYRNRFQYIQVDEGQDTSKAQIEIIKIISHPKNNLFIVADDDQSIYGFRGAYPKGLFEFSKIYKNGKVFYMEQNYRSTKNIVNISNKFIKQNSLRYNKNIFTENDYLEPISIVKVNTVEEQYKYLLDDINSHKDYANTAILYRNNISAIGIIEYLDRDDLPFYMRDNKMNFFNHWIIDDILCFLKLAQNPTDIKAFENIYFKMKGFISKKQLNYIKTLNYNQSIFDRLLNCPGINSFYKENFLELKMDFKKLSKLPPSEGISYIEKNLKYKDYLKESCIKSKYTIDTLMTMLYFLKIIASKVKNLNELTGRIRYLEYITNKSTENKDGITLSTVHSAKGLEFERVYIVDLIDGDFPSTTSIDNFLKGNIESLEEERRLFYVGMTRAKKYLSLITINNRNGKEVKPSRFITELENLITQD